MLRRQTVKNELFNPEAFLPHELRIEDFASAMRDIYDFLFDVNGMLRLQAFSPEQMRDVWMLLERLTGPDASTGAFAP